MDDATTARRIFPVSDWSPYSEAFFQRASPATSGTETPSSSGFKYHRVLRRASQTPLSGGGDASLTEHRSRSMSVTLPWRHRPKSACFDTLADFALAGDPPAVARASNSEDHLFAQRRSDMIGPALNGNPDCHEPAQHEQHSFNLRKLLRRASVSVRSGVKGFVSNRRVSLAGPSQRPAHAGEGNENNALFASSQNPGLIPSSPAAHPFGNLGRGSYRPTTSQSTWYRLRQATSFSRPSSRMLYTGHGHRTFEVAIPSGAPAYPVPGSGVQPPIIPSNTGAAARLAAAAHQQGHHESHGFDAGSSAAGVPPTSPDSSTMPKQSPVPLHLPEPDDVDNSDHESGIGIALTSTDMDQLERSQGGLDRRSVDSTYQTGVEVHGALTVRSPLSGTARGGNITKVDFVSKLPAELAIQILALLDAHGLTTAARVSRSWRAVVGNQHIWRESFLREKTGTYATCGGRVRPGVGLGVPPIRPENDWRQIYRAKEQLDKRWREGKARAIYLHGHSDSIYCLQFDENKIITGSRDKTIRVWDMHTFACKLVVGPPEVINDQDLALLYDADGQPQHWAMLPNDPDATSLPPRPHPSIPALYCPPTHHKASILCLQYDDQILVTGSSDATCIMYNVRNGYRPIRRLRHHSAAVLDLVFDGRFIVTCSKDVSICVWDRETGGLIRQLRGHAGPVNAVQMRGSTIVSCSGDFRVKLWNADTGKAIREFLGHNKGLACSQFSEDGRYVASAGNDRSIRVWDANTGECVKEMQRAHDNLVRSLHVDSVSGRLVSGSYDSDIKVWDLETGAPLLDFPKWHSSWVLSAKSDYRRIVSSGQDPKVLIMDFGADVEGIQRLESGGVDWWDQQPSHGRTAPAGGGAPLMQEPELMDEVYGGYI